MSDHVSENLFRTSVIQGLSASPKFLSSKYFYDEKGSMIFEQIMRMPEYYLTACELNILQTQSNDLLETLQTIPARVIEFGSGDGSKTLHFLEALSIKNPALYVPVDISAQSIRRLSENIHKNLPGQKIEAFEGDYFSFQALPYNHPTLFLFFGSNIGNFSSVETSQLLMHFHKNMREGDSLLIGFDLQKDPSVILRAYNDPHGITRNFNLNLLDRINRELGANFRLDEFDFTVTYDQKNGELKSFLKSLKKQQIEIDSLPFSFESGELIWTELSKKFTLTEIEKLAFDHQFRFKKHFLDSQKYFAVSLWEK